MVADQEEIHRLSLSKNVSDRSKALWILRNEFHSIFNKSAVWNDLHKLTNDNEFLIRSKAAELLGIVFKYIPEKHKSAAWEDFHRLTTDENSHVRSNITYSLGITFKDIPEEHKSAAWDDFHRLTSDKSLDVRFYAIRAFSYVFKHIDKQQKSVAWVDLIRLSNDSDWEIRRKSGRMLCLLFKDIPDERKSAAWDELQRSISDLPLFFEDNAAFVIGSVFKYIPDKSAAWADLHKLASEDDWKIRRNVAYAIGFCFEYIPDKSAAWTDLHKLTSEDDWEIRGNVAYAIGSSFQYIPDKSAAWKDLHKLTFDRNPYVRVHGAYAIGSSFEYIPDKSAALYDLISLINIKDVDSNVKMYANYSLGKICIYKASTSKNVNDSISQLEKAIQYFQGSLKERTWENPAKFCYPFYCSFNAIFFKKESSMREIENYIIAAKKEIRDSEVKEKLIEAIEQLASILELARYTKESGIEYQELLKRCLDIFNRVEQLMHESKDKNPALYGLYRIAKPSFDKTITELIDNIREKIEIGRKKAVGTPFESLYDNAEREVKEWKTGTDEENLAVVEGIVSVIRDNLPHEKVEVIHDELNKTIVEKNIPELLEVIRKVIQESSSYADLSKTDVSNQLKVVNSNFNELLIKFTQFAKDTTHMYETINERTIRTENKLDSIIQTVTELKDLSSKLKAEGNEKESKEVIDIADKIKALFDSGDKKDIAFFIEKLREKVPTLLEEIDKSNAPNNVKEKAKMDLKEKIMKAGKDVAFAVSTNWIATYLPLIVGAEASGLLVPGIILAALLSIDNLRDQGK